jgi:hypothetical protein
VPVFVITYPDREVGAFPQRVRIQRPLVVTAVEQIPPGVAAMLLRRDADAGRLN